MNKILVSSLEGFIKIIHDPKLLEVNHSKSPILRLITNHKWKEIQENILDETKDHLLKKTVEQALLAGGVACISLTSIFTK
jgi:hypothetical protein